MMKKKILTIKYILIVLGFLFFVFVGEIVNMLNNPEQQLIPLLIKLTNNAVSRNDSKKSLLYLNISSHLLVIRNSRLFKIEKTDVGGSEIYTGDLNTTSEQIILGELKDFFTNVQISNSVETISFINYRLFLRFYSDGDYKLAEKFIKNAVVVNPTLPQYHLERINYHLLQGEKDVAESANEYCHLFETPKNICSNFYNELINVPSHEEVGFHLKSIVEHLYRNANYSSLSI